VGARTHRAAAAVIQDASPSRLAILVHEVRSPVAALRAIRETVVAGEADDDSRRQLVRLVLAACEAIERIVVDASLVSLERERVDVGTLLRDVASAAELRGGRVRVGVAANVPEAELDPVRVRQALDNLLENALAQTPADAEVLLDARVEDGAVVVSVTDSGPGIPESEQARIFDPGVRLGSTYTGTGLGLAVVKAIVEAHGGTVGVASRPGEGATFTISLPLASVEG
jgi:signal transduction histidine kinase